jgi:hypothetical protein
MSMLLLDYRDYCIMYMYSKSSSCIPYTYLSVIYQCISIKLNEKENIMKVKKPWLKGIHFEDERKLTHVKKFQIFQIFLKPPQKTSQQLKHQNADVSLVAIWELLTFCFVFFFIHLFICACIIWAFSLLCSPPPPSHLQPLTSR